MQASTSGGDSATSRKYAIGKSTLLAGSIAASAGFVFGATSGLFRNVSPFLFGSAAACQWFGLGSIYWATRASVLGAWHPEPSKSMPSHRDRLYSSLTGGGLAGMVMAALTRGRRNVIPATIMFAALAGCGQGLVNWQESLGAQLSDTEGKLAWVAKQKWSPVGILTDAEYAKRLEEKVLNLDVEIALIEDQISDIRSKATTTSDATQSPKA